MTSDNKAGGAYQQAKGKVQDAVGGALGKPGLKAKGKINQAVGAGKQALTDAQD